MTLAGVLAAVDVNASEVWKLATDNIISNLAKTRRTFNSDDIWEGLSYAGFTTHENRAMGPRILSAIKRGLIKIATCDHCKTVKVMTTSQREEAHQMDIAVYTSLVYGATA